MARSFARLATSIWVDDDFRQRSPEAQRVYMLAFSQPTIALTGVVPYTPRRWARMANGTTTTDIEQAIAELVEHRYVIVDDDTEELLVRSFTRHDGVIRSPKTLVPMTTEYEAIESPALRQAFQAELEHDLIERQKPEVQASLNARFVADFNTTTHRPDGASHGVPDSPSDTPSQHPKNGVSDSPSHGVPDRASLTRARARAAEALAEAEAEASPHPRRPNVAPNVAQNPDPEQPDRPAAAPHGDDEDEATSSPGCSRDADVWRRLAEHDLKRWLDGGGTISSRRGWLAKAAKNRRDVLADDLEAAVAGGMSRQAFVDQVLDWEADAADGDGGGDGERRGPTWEETQARQAAEDARVDADRAERATWDAAIDALGDTERDDLEARARARLAEHGLTGPKVPAAAVRAEMRSLLQEAAGHKP